MTIDNEIIRKELMNMSEEKYRLFSSALIPGCTNMLGVRIPALRSYAKKLAKGDYDAYLKNASDDSFEELLLQGLVIGYIKADFDLVTRYCDRFIPKINNWSVNDSFCSGMKCFIMNQEKGFEYIKKYINSDKEFECRAAIVLLMDYYLNSEYLDKVFSLISIIQNDAYYVRMAIAWTFTTAYTKYPDETLDYLTSINIDDVLRKNIIRKVNESRKITINNKDRIKRI